MFENPKTRLAFTKENVNKSYFIVCICNFYHTKQTQFGSQPNRFYQKRILDESFLALQIVGCHPKCQRGLGARYGIHWKMHFKVRIFLMGVFAYSQVLGCNIYYSNTSLHLLTFQGVFGSQPNIMIFHPNQDIVISQYS